MLLGDYIWANVFQVQGITPIMDWSEEETGSVARERSRRSTRILDQVG